MADPLFEAFRQPIDVSPPDPGELRRRGERRARRTTLATMAAVAAVVAGVVVPVAALSGGGDDRPAPLVPTPTSTAKAVAWVQRIPDDFPLGAGLPMPGEATAAMERGNGTPLQPCLEGQSSLGQAGWTDVATATNADVVDPADGTDMRTLALYADGPSAEHALASVEEMYTACPPGQTGPAPIVVERIGDGHAWVVTPAATDSRVGQLVTIERVGNALLFQQDSLRPHDSRSEEQQLADVRAGQEAVVAAMCIFAESPCPAAVSSTPSAEATGGSGVPRVAEIPADFPIDAAHEDLGSDGTVSPPSRDGRRVVLDPCGTDVFDRPEQDRLAFQVTGPEYADTRELRTYPSADDAVFQMQRLRDAVVACPRQESSVPGGAALWSTHPVDTGYDSIAVAQTYEQGLGGGVWLFTRVGRSILALVQGGEYAPDNVWDALPRLVERTGQIAPSMCRFTVAGC